MPFGSTPIPDFLDRRYSSAVRPNRWLPTRGSGAGSNSGPSPVPGLTMEADEIMQNLCGIRTCWPWADVDLWEFFIWLRAQDKAPDNCSKEAHEEAAPRKGSGRDPRPEAQDRLRRVDPRSRSTTTRSGRWLEEPSFHDARRGLRPSPEASCVERDLGVDGFHVGQRPGGRLRVRGNRMTEVARNRSGRE